MFIRFLAAVLVGAVLSSCATLLPEAPPPQANPGPYDGDYGVSLTYHKPSGTCLGSRIQAKFWVRGGVMGGYVNHPIAGNFIVNGDVLEDGRLRNARAVGPSTVSFEGAIDSGTWSSGSDASCAGRFITALIAGDGAGNRRAAAAQPPRPAAASPASSAVASVPIAISWEGIPDVLLGTLGYSSAGDGGMIEVRGSKIFCHGQWKQAPGGIDEGGSWTVSCSNGKVASGTFSSRGQRRGTGRGVDTALNEVKVTFGQ